MQDLIEHLKALKQHIEEQHWEDSEGPSLRTIDGVITRLGVLDQEHTRQTDELRGLREEQEEISRDVNQARKKLNIWQDELSGLPDDVAFLLTDIGGQLTEAKDDAAALRGVLVRIRDTARKVEYDDSDLTDVYIRDLLGSVAHQSAEGLKEHKTGKALAKDWRQLEALVDGFENGMRETGGWSYSGDRTLAQRVQRCIDHYTRMAAQAVDDTHNFKDGVVSWLRGIAINAQAVSWGSTHHEKDARLRGLIEVIETAIEKINQRRMNDRLSDWNGVVDSWMKSDFPTREMRRRILDQDAEIKRLRQKAGEPDPDGVQQDTFDF